MHNASFLMYLKIDLSVKFKSDIYKLFNTILFKVYCSLLGDNDNIRFSNVTEWMARQTLL